MEETTLFQFIEGKRKVEEEISSKVREFEKTYGLQVKGLVYLNGEIQIRVDL